MNKLLLLLLLIPVSVSGQTAKVIQLSAEDAVQAKSLYDAQKALDKQKSDFEDKIRTNYLTRKPELTSPDCAKQSATCLTIMNSWPSNGLADGWSNGFEYSEDFRFIVPKPYTPSPIIWNGGVWPSCTIPTTSPYTITNGTNVGW